MDLIPVSDVRTVAVVGAGAIGASWASAFLAQGKAVRVTDADPARKAYVEDYVRNAWPALVRIGLARDGELEVALGRLSFHADLAEAVSAAQFVQENVFERLDLKQDVLARIDAALPAGGVIASSTSGFGASRLQEKMAAPGRLLIGHPFNPPHLIPLVEVVGGERTDPAAADWLMEFYASVGKHPILIRKEVRGHVANRLQAALWREAVHLVETGVASVADVDAAIAYGPGLRWAIMGPHLTFHLGGGTGGMRHFVEHLGPPISEWWAELGTPALTPEVNDKLVAGVDAEIAGRSYETLVADRDRKLLDILEALKLSAAPAS